LAAKRDERNGEPDARLCRGGVPATTPLRPKREKFEKPPALQKYFRKKYRAIIMLLIGPVAQLDRAAVS
jgi:hypothetical protein